MSSSQLVTVSAFILGTLLLASVAPIEASTQSFGDVQQSARTEEKSSRKNEECASDS